jgi:hypothetical protein
MSLRTVAAARARTMETDMRALRALWGDESGLVLSAEAVAVGALGVAGVTVGAGALAHSVNAELEETAFAIRSLDQSYSFPEQKIGNAFVAGSSFTQKPVKEAHKELREQIERDRAAQEKAQKAEEPKPAVQPPKKKKKKNKADDDELEPVTFVPEASN